MTRGTVTGEEVESFLFPAAAFGFFPDGQRGPSRSQPLLDEFLQLADAGGLLLGGGGAEGQGGAAVAS